MSGEEEGKTNKIATWVKIIKKEIIRNINKIKKYYNFLLDGDFWKRSF